MEKRKLKVSFGPSVTRYNDIIGRALEAAFDVEYTDDSPDLRFVSDTEKKEPKRPGCRQIVVAIENTWPDFNRQAGGLIFLYSDHPRVLRLPFYTLVSKPEELIKDADFADRILAEERKFCAFVASNMNQFRTFKRVDFFKKLHARRHVDAGGSLLNNMGGKVEFGKLEEFYSQYKFVMAIENQDWPGYTTEKIIKAMRNGCIPIYWGNPRIDEEFNTRSFINLHDFTSDEAAIDHILEVADDDKLRREYLEQPFFHNNEPNEWYGTERVTEYFKRLLDMPEPQSKLPYIKHAVFLKRRKLKPYLDALKRIVS